MAAKIFHCLMVIMCIVASVWLLVLYGEVIRAHLGLFVFLWFFLPSLAFWLGSQFMRPNFSTTYLSLVRTILMAGVISISFCLSLSNLPNNLRDTIGHRFVEGYWVEYHEVEDTDDYGRPDTILAREFGADHWYALVGLWVFEFSLLIPVIGLPYLTWYACTKAIKASEKETSLKRSITPHTPQNRMIKNQGKRNTGRKVKVGPKPDKKFPKKSASVNLT